MDVQALAEKHACSETSHPRTRPQHRALFCSALSGPVAAVKDAALNVLRESASLSAAKQTVC